MKVKYIAEPYAHNEFEKKSMTLSKTRKSLTLNFKTTFQSAVNITKMV